MMLMLTLFAYWFGVTWLYYFVDELMPGAWWRFRWLFNAAIAACAFYYPWSVLPQCLCHVLYI